MNRADTIARVKLLGATDARPVLTDTEVGSLVDSHAITDADGIAPGGTGWVATYDVHAATAEVWRVKAAKVAGDFNFSADDASYSKGDVLAHCLEMEARYQAMAGSPSGTGTGNAGTILVAGTGGGSAYTWDGTLIP